MERRIWWLVAAIGLLTTAFHAERLFAEPITLPYCIERSKLAIDIAKTVQSGLTMDRINLEYAIPPSSEEEASNRQAWVAELKGEIVVLMQTVQDPDMVGQKVLENCAYAYGKLRRTASSDGMVETDKYTARYCLYRKEKLSVLYDVVKEAGSIEAMMEKYPPPPSVEKEVAANIALDILESEDKGKWLKTEWLKCIGNQI